MAGGARQATAGASSDAGALPALCVADATGPDAEAIERAVCEFGRTAFAFDVVQCRERYAFFASRAVRGALVPYRRVGGADVVIGEPLAPLEALGTVVSEFLRDRRAAGRRVLGLLASEAFARAAVAAGASAAQITSEPEIDPASWEPRGHSAKKLRSYVRRLRREGVEGLALPAGRIPPSELRRAADALIEAWIARGVARGAHLLEVDAWRRAESKRYFAVLDPKRADRIWSLLIAHPVPAREGWHLCHLARHPDAPKGVTELVVATAIERLGEEGVRYATFGAVADPRPGVFLGVGRLRAEVFARAYRLAAAAGGYARTVEFYRKIHAGPWAPRFLVFDPPRALVRGFYAVMRITHASGLLPRV